MNVEDRALELKEIEFEPNKEAVTFVILSAEGNENSVGFSLEFDPKTLSLTSFTISEELPDSRQVFINSNRAAEGKIGFLIGLPPGQNFSAGANELLNITWKPTDAEPKISFGDSPVYREVVSVDAEILPCDYKGDQDYTEIQENKSAPQIKDSKSQSKGIIQRFIEWLSNLFNGWRVFFNSF